MKEYKDNNNKKLRKGFYKYYGQETIFYFTGNYTKKGFPIIENEFQVNPETYFPERLTNPTKDLYRLTKKFIKEKIKKSKEKINWLEKGLQN
jgi:hypothetical protein